MSSRLRPRAVDGLQGGATDRRNVVMGVATAKQALADSGLEVTDANRDEIGVIFGSGVGGPELSSTTWRSATRRARAR